MEPRRDVPLAARLPAARDRRRWWTDVRRTLSWLSPAEVLRCGKVGQGLVLIAALADADGGADLREGPGNA